jgi:hypothetical protein
MKYLVSVIGATTSGHCFSITDSNGTPLALFEFETEVAAKEAQRLIGQTIAIATKITPCAR